MVFGYFPGGWVDGWLWRAIIVLTELGLALLASWNWAFSFFIRSCFETFKVGWVGGLYLGIMLTHFNCNCTELGKRKKQWKQWPGLLFSKSKNFRHFNFLSKSWSMYLSCATHVGGCMHSWPLLTHICILYTIPYSRNIGKWLDNWQLICYTCSLILCEQVWLH